MWSIDSFKKNLKVLIFTLLSLTFLLKKYPKQDIVTNSLRIDINNTNLKKKEISEGYKTKRLNVKRANFMSLQAHRQSVFEQQTQGITDILRHDNYEVFNKFTCS